MLISILSPLQMACLRWVSQGPTIAEIALLEGKSVQEIEQCIAYAVSLLGAKSVDEAIAKAVLS